MLTALVTGACGFIGRYVAREYKEKGYYVVGIGHGTWDEEYSNWGLDDWHCGDISIELLCKIRKLPDVIIHCAGGSSVGKSVDEPRHDYIRTVDSVSCVLEYMRLYAKDARLVYLSSAAVYGTAENLPIGVDCKCNPISPYGVHKKMAEDLCVMYGKQYGIKSVVMRLFSVYGNGLQKQLLWDACGKISSGVNRFFGTGEETRDWIHVSDVARYLEEACQYASIKSPVFNLACGKSVRIVDVLTTLFRYMESAETPVFDGRKDVGNPIHYWADISGIELWQTEPMIGLEDGIKLYVEWFEKNEKQN